MENKINTELRNGSNLIQVASNNAKYYEKLAEENAKKSEKSVQECASYIGLVQKVLSDCQSVQKGLEDAVDDKIHIHTEDYNNPHEVTAEQIGTYTKSEIDAKVSVDNVQSYVVEQVQKHSLQKNNPHEVTAEQIGTYTKSEIDAKVSVDNVQSYVVEQVQKHSLQNNNPHCVTATQVGAYSSNAVDTMFEDNKMYLAQNVEDTEWSRVFYSDKDKSTIEWIEQGGFKTYTTSLAAGRSVSVAVTLPVSYGKGNYTRMASSVNDGIYCYVEVANTSDDGTTLNVHLRNVTSKAITPSGFWWQTFGAYTKGSSSSGSGGYEGGKDLPDE